MLRALLVAPYGTDYTSVLKIVYRVPKWETKHLEALCFVLASSMSRDPMTHGAN